MRRYLPSCLRSLGACGIYGYCLVGSLAMAEDGVLVFQAVDVAVAPAAAVEVEIAAGEVAVEPIAVEAAAAEPAAAGGLGAVAREMGRALTRLIPQRAEPAPAVVAEWAVANQFQPDQVNAMMLEIRPTLVAEVSFAKRACELNPDEIKAAATAAKTAGKDFLTKYLQQNGQAQNGVMLFNGPQPVNNQSDPVTALQTSVVDAIKKTLPAEKLPLYEAEVVHRNEFRRTAVADNLTAIIDERLYLTEKQRAGIAESLRDAAKDETLPPLDNLMHGGNYLPQMPEQPIAAHLDKNQLQRWQHIPKVQFGTSFRGNQQVIDGSQMIDDVDLGDE